MELVGAPLTRLLQQTKKPVIGEPLGMKDERASLINESIIDADIAQDYENRT